MLLSEIFPTPAPTIKKIIRRNGELRLISVKIPEQISYATTQRPMFPISKDRK
jgi:hypothetical protein